MALTAEHLIVVGRGRLIADISVNDLIARSARGIRVRTPRVNDLVPLLAGHGVKISSTTGDVIEVQGRSTEEIAHRALARGIPLFELTPQQASLEEAYMEITEDSVEYHGTTTGKAA
jgi:ABC-2 type transport system ATP-binding protein